MWDTIAQDAAAESPLWDRALRPSHERELVAVFSPLARERHMLGIETIYEGYLLHYGRPRLFAPATPEDALLLGDYLYAQGLVRIARSQDVVAVADLAELISLCAQMHADSRDGDGWAWAATVALLGAGRLDDARTAFRLAGDAEPLATLARGAAGADSTGRAVAAHRTRIR
jgi:hypothetical protein